MIKKICISGYYGFDNFGDETILRILVDNLKKINNDSQITVFSSNPSKTSKNLEVNSVHSFNIPQVLNKIIKTDYLISGGGSLLQDSTSIKSLIYYLAIIFTAQFFRKKTIIFAQGIGPINNKYLRKITAFLLKKASYVSVRDDNSLKLLKEWGINANLCSDPVWNLNPSIQERTGNKVGIQLRDYSTVHNAFLTQLAFCINKHYKDKEIYIFSLQNQLDLDVCRNLRTRLISINPDLNIQVVENTSNDKVIEDIAKMDELIAMRYHACLIAIKNKVKLLPIDYDIKVEELAKEFNLDYIDMVQWENISAVFDKFTKSSINYDETKINNKILDFNTIF